MSDFNQDMENLLHAYDSNWQDYLILREQFIEKYKLSVEKLQEQLNTAKKALTEISKTKDFYRSGRDHWEEFSQDALKAQKALAAIGGDDE
ncbi:hypothetical protein MK801_03995 [Lactococcus lactis]|uniref:hypothetical protein n=1 Tax=Lactococcus lactis TaxID=1358 RepID=UPI0020B896EB|nr:hypothetical protein MK801_03995 [Lactococcus lactis]